MTHPPTDPRARLSDTLDYLTTISGDAARLGRALAEHQKIHAADHPTRSALARLQSVTEDFARVIAHETANLSAKVRAAISA